MSNVDDSINPSRNQVVNVEKAELLFSPRFRSIAALAGWDEEALLLATSIVEDTPDRILKNKKRSGLQNSKSPLSNSRRKRKTPRRNPASIPITILNLEEDLDASTSSKADTSAEVEKSNAVEEANRKSYEFSSSQGIERVKIETGASTSAVAEKSNADEKAIKTSLGPSLPCLDRLREELSCAICLDICYEPSSTPCGHSFCKQCLRSAADKCGKKCPKCRQLISNGKYCTVNTVLWNTIQLLFPQEVEARKTTAVTSSSEKTEKGSSSRDRRLSARNQTIQALNSPESESETTTIERRNNRIGRRNSRPSGTFTRRVVNTDIELPSQDEDAALALRLQREEFLAIRVRGERSNSRVNDERRNSLAVARANLRAMAARENIESYGPRAPVSRADLRAMAARTNIVYDEPRVPDPDERRHSLAVARANLRAMAARAINVRSRDRTR